MNEKLDYYQKNTKQAFREGFTMRTHYEVIEPECYQVYKYYLPVNASKKITWVKKYFESLDGLDIENTFKRRKSHVEFAETALLMLTRINWATMKDRYIVAGSEYVSPIAWCVFGRSDYAPMSKMHFSNIVEIANHYKNYTHGNCYPIDIHFRMGSDWANRIAKRFHKPMLKSPNLWMTVALLLTYDLIHNCGPDCSEFFELFTNDYREHSSDFNLDQWERLRCKILGCSPFDINKVPFRPRARIIHREWVEEPPKKPFKAKTEIALISESQDLAEGEKTFATFRPKPVQQVVDTKTLTERYEESNATTTIPVLWPEDIGMHHALGIRRLGGKFRGEGWFDHVP